jgi:hypothetical protein
VLDRSPAATGKDADPKESVQDLEGRGRRQAAIGGRHEDVNARWGDH